MYVKIKAILGGVPPKKPRKDFCDEKSINTDRVPLHACGHGAVVCLLWQLKRQFW